MIDFSKKSILVILSFMKNIFFISIFIWVSSCYAKVHTEPNILFTLYRDPLHPKFNEKNLSSIPESYCLTNAQKEGLLKQ